MGTRAPEPRKGKTMDIKTEMKKILQRRINHQFKNGHGHTAVLPIYWSENTIKYCDLLGNKFEVPSVKVIYQDRIWEEAIAYPEEVVLESNAPIFKDYKVGSWARDREGNICW